MDQTDFRVFIAYQGTYDKEGSISKAEEIYRFLIDQGVKTYFFPRMDDKKFGETPIIASHSDLFLLVANPNIKINAMNEIGSSGLQKEIKAFYDQIYKNKRQQGNARIYAYGGLSLEQADGLHLMFNNMEHFSEDLFGKDQAYQKLIEWVNLYCPKVKENQQKEIPLETTYSLKDLFEQSKYHFRNSIREICEEEDDLFNPLLQKYSKLFACNAVLKSQSVINLEEGLFDFLTEKIETDPQISILKISGNNGSDKNSIMQMLYINIYRRARAGLNKILPLYINLNFYEKQEFGPSDNINKLISERISNDLCYYLEYINKEPDLTPIIFIDGLRKFKLCQTSTEMVLSRILQPMKNLKKVVSVDTGYDQNQARRNEISSLAPSTFTYHLKIHPIDLADQERCLCFFQAFGDLYNIDINHLYPTLKKLFFYEIDTYIIKLVVNMISDNQDRTSFTVSDLYHNLCLRYLNGNEETLLQAGENAFKFLYSDHVFADREVFAEKGWVLIKRHSTIVDFLVAYYYVDHLKKIESEEDLSFFEIILPKEITRFVIPLINKSVSCQEKIIEIVRKYYDRFDTFAKSEFTYWLGRLEIKKYRDEAQQILYDLFDNQLDLVMKRKAEPSYRQMTMKNDLFVLRGIIVSLIYYNDEAMLDRYLHALLDDDLCNMINRGFHLEYYGDKPYVANREMLDFDDDVEIGEKTMKHLSTKLVKKMMSNSYAATLKLDLFTLCSLIQLRIESVENQEKFFQKNKNLKLSYFQVCEDCLVQYLEQNNIDTNEKINLYFSMFYDDLHAFNNDQKVNISSSYYENLARLSETDRSGWRNLKIPERDRESIIEHIYNTWLLGMLFLPLEVEFRNDYNKEKILKMILIHDLAESITGDIPSPDKKKNTRYDWEEDIVMRKLLLKGTYDGIENLNYYYEIWEEFVEGQSINAKIAKELDVIQLIFQFCKYYLRYPELISVDEKNLWLRAQSNIKTPIGKSILQKVVEQNPNFSKAFA